MGFLRKIGSFLGISRDDADHPDSPSSAAAAAELPHDRAAAAAAAHGARRGFSVQVPVPVERQGPGPVLVPCPQGDGGVQGFRWYTRRLRIDEDGDVADEFLDEIIPEDSVNNNTSPVGRFQVKYNTKPTPALRKHVIAVDGDIRHSLEHQGQLRWV
ncbi:uncharacterized protein LOC8055080 [Sorghum bicolor]|uniref:Uncharacterized protein n=1 Tax=Sorghum bicolor TaxID=4558 RepID=C5XTR4_SORBI|nr:uncharacterized protein LOC8055080 [Sorghum bicolor]EES04438.1 hypothetical protein SORBI_3004G026400 [Sorghum bicolor]|eukprot:XP_002451462.1 uncharacterized protein LOC8055080 [Sorghum bicolor]